jgi:hypothetical protein
MLIGRFCRLFGTREGAGAWLAFVFLAVSACGTSAPERNRLEELDRARQLIDRKEYLQAVESLDSSLKYWPGDQGFAELLGSAHLGAAGFELLPFVKRVLGAQDTVPLGLYDEPVCAAGAVEHFSELEFNCALYRIMKQLPPVDDFHFLAARNVYRQYFGDPKSTHSHVNFISGLVEFGSALTRARVLLNSELVSTAKEALATDMMKFPLDPAIHHLKRGIDELNRAIERFRYSYSELNKLIAAQEGTPLLTIGGRTLLFNGSLQIGDFVRFLGDIVYDRGEALDRELSEAATQRVNALAPGFLTLFDILTTGVLPVEGPAFPQLTVSGRLKTGFGIFVRNWMYAAAERSDLRVEVRFFELAWTNPPPLVRDFMKAAQDSWDLESGDPLRAYFIRTGPEWLEFKEIANDWNSWLYEDLDSASRQQVFSAIQPKTEIQQLALTPPATFEPASFKSWMVYLNGFFAQQVDGVLTGLPVESNPFTSPQVVEGLLLLDRTNSWCDRNFYPMAEWVTVSGAW